MNLRGKGRSRQRLISSEIRPGGMLAASMIRQRRRVRAGCGRSVECVAYCSQPVSSCRSGLLLVAHRHPARRHRVPHAPGIPHDTAAVSRSRNLRR
jgi:hypothetical protein